MVKDTGSFDVTFVSDNNINSSGFYAEYYIFPGATTTDGILPPGNLGQGTEL